MDKAVLYTKGERNCFFLEGLTIYLTQPNSGKRHLVSSVLKGAFPAARLEHIRLGISVPGDKAAFIKRLSLMQFNWQ